MGLLFRTAVSSQSSSRGLLGRCELFLGLTPVCHHRSLARVTYIYCRPSVLETETGRVAVDTALSSLASELALNKGVQLREPGGNSITVRDIEPRDLWRAMDRAVPNWEDQDLFFPPVFFDPG